MEKSYRIMVFSWNTESISLCSSMKPEPIEDNTSSSVYNVWNYIPNIWSTGMCEVPDFFNSFKIFINNNKPDVIAIGFQEDRKPGSYFHSHFLVEEMPKIGYELVKRTRLMGVGVTSVKNAMKGDLHSRGLRLSIYAKKELISEINSEEITMRNTFGNDGHDEHLCTSILTRGKGAVVSYLKLPGMGRIAFINAHLPFNSKSLVDSYVKRNPMLRQNELNYSNTCFNNIVEELVYNKDPKPDHVIYLGDLNYRISNVNGAANMSAAFHENYDNEEFINSIYKKYDELKEQMRRGNIYEFSEGVGGEGPRFVPTCKMTKGRTTDRCYKSEDSDTNCWKLGKSDQRVPSWCDRILYSKFGHDKTNLVCTYYNRFDTGEVMSKSDHAGVIALYETA